VVESSSAEMPDNINRYLLLTVDTAVVANRKSVLAFANLCGILIVGFIVQPKVYEWKGTKVKLRKGTLQIPTKYQAPGDLGKLLFDRANDVAKVEFSDRQRRKQADRFEKNVDRLKGSETARAWELDFRLLRPLDG